MTTTQQQRRRHPRGHDRTRHRSRSRHRTLFLLFLALTCALLHLSHTCTLLLPNAHTGLSVTTSTTTYGPALVRPDCVLRVFPNLSIAPSTNTTNTTLPPIRFALTLPQRGALAQLVPNLEPLLRFAADMLNARGGLLLGDGTYHPLTLTWMSDDSSDVLAAMFYDAVLGSIATTNCTGTVLIGPVSTAALRTVAAFTSAQNVPLLSTVASPRSLLSSLSTPNTSAPSASASAPRSVLGAFDPSTFLLPTLRAWYANLLRNAATATSANNRYANASALVASTTTACVLAQPGPYAQQVCSGARNFLTSASISMLVDANLTERTDVGESSAALAPCLRVDLLVVCMDDANGAVMRGFRASRVWPKLAITTVGYNSLDVSTPTALETVAPWLTLPLMGERGADLQATLPNVLFANFSLLAQQLALYDPDAAPALLSSPTAMLWLAAFDMLVSAISLAHSLNGTELYRAWASLRGTTFLANATIDRNTGMIDAAAALFAPIYVDRADSAGRLRVATLGSGGDADTTTTTTLSSPLRTPAEWPWDRPIEVGDNVDLDAPRHAIAPSSLVILVSTWIAHVTLMQAAESFMRGHLRYLLHAWLASIAIGVVGVWVVDATTICFFAFRARGDSVPFRLSLGLLASAFVVAASLSFLGIVVMIHQVPFGRAAREWQLRMRQARWQIGGGAAAAATAAASRGMEISQKGVSRVSRSAAPRSVSHRTNHAEPSRVQSPPPQSPPAVEAPYATTTPQRTASLCSKLACVRWFRYRSWLRERRRAAHTQLDWSLDENAAEPGEHEREHEREREHAPNDRLRRAGSAPSGTHAASAPSDTTANPPNIALHLVRCTLCTYGIYSFVGGAILSIAVVLPLALLLGAFDLPVTWTWPYAPAIASHVIVTLLASVGVQWTMCAPSARFVGGLLTAAAIIVHQAIQPLTVRYAWTRIPDPAGVRATDSTVSVLGCRLVAGTLTAITLLIFVALQFQRLKLSRHDLKLVNSRLKYAVASMQAQVELRERWTVLLLVRITRACAMLDFINLSHDPVHMDLAMLAMEPRNVDVHGLLWSQVRVPLVVVQDVDADAVHTGVVVDGRSRADTDVDPDRSEDGVVRKSQHLSTSKLNVPSRPRMGKASKVSDAGPSHPAFMTAEEAATQLANGVNGANSTEQPQQSQQAQEQQQQKRRRFRRRTRAADPADEASAWTSASITSASSASMTTSEHAAAKVAPIRADLMQLATSTLTETEHSVSRRTPSHRHERSVSGARHTQQAAAVAAAAVTSISPLPSARATTTALFDGNGTASTRLDGDCTQGAPRTSSIELRDVLQHPVCVQVLKRFLAQSHAEETLLFYVAAQRYKTLPPCDATRLHAARLIVHLFVREGGQLQVNLSQAMCQRLLRAVAEADGGGGGGVAATTTAGERQAAAAATMAARECGALAPDYPTIFDLAAHMHNAPAAKSARWRAMLSRRSNLSSSREDGASSPRGIKSPVSVGLFTAADGRVLGFGSFGSATRCPLSPPRRATPLPSTLFDEAEWEVLH